MIPDNPLARARQHAHANLRQQAFERAGKLLQGGPGQVTAPMLRGAGNPGGAAALYESRHPAAMAGNAAMPNWVLGQMQREINHGGSVPQIGPPQPAQGAGGSGFPGDIQRVGSFGPHGGGISEGLAPGGFRLPEEPSGEFSGGNPLVHLGQGIFLHLGTGELHGFGPQHVPGGPIGGPMSPIHPGPVNF